MSAPPPPRVRLNLGVTGHRADNAAFTANRSRIETVLAEILDLITGVVAAEAPILGGMAPVRLHGLLADGADEMAARSALARGWDLVATLPFGRVLNAAINARPASGEEARALISGSGLVGEATRARADAILELSDQAHCFELAERDTGLTTLFLDAASAPGDLAKAQLFAAACSERVALAGRVMIEQTDIVIAVWDGATQTFVGGTGHTIVEALAHAAPVVWIDARAPEAWRILLLTESLAEPGDPGQPSADREAALAALAREVLRPGQRSRGHGADDGLAGITGLAKERWPRHSHGLSHGYRRIEALFGSTTMAQRFRGLRQTYETPEAIATGSGAHVMAACAALPGLGAQMAPAIDLAILRRFAWADGVSAHLSDVYRGGMVANFLLSPLAIVGGIAWLPLRTPGLQWVFELFEFVMLGAIVLITLFGRARRWHGRWFEIRRVAEYFRHGPILLLAGVARAPGRWPTGARTSWPEWFARQGLREVGLPAVAVTSAYLRLTLDKLLGDHVLQQRNYHRVKAARLAAAHRNLDRLSGGLFGMAILVVAAYLGMEGAAALGLIDPEIPAELSTISSYLAILLPTLGAAVAGIRYFGDFERFSAISEVSAEKLDAIHSRIQLLLAAPDEALDYGRVSDLAHAADDVVVSEIESWQAVFSGKHTTVPV